MPRNEDYASALVRKPRIRERSTILERIANKFNKLVETFVDNV